MIGDPRTDEALVASLQSGDEGALRLLYARYAGLVYSIARRVSPGAAAEDVVQAVFLTLWRKSATFDPQRGTFKAWLGRVARNHALNERRREGGATTGEAPVDEVADEAPSPDEAQWIAHRNDVLRCAVEALPEPQRRAVSLAFFDELPHAEVASVLGAPLGTVKTRIRLSLKQLGPVLAALSVLVAVITFGWRLERDDQRQARALRMVTSSDVVPLRLEAQAGIPAAAHGTYRARAGQTVAVLTTSALPVLDGGERYVGWARVGSVWVSFGGIEPGPDGRSLSVVENAALMTIPDELRVTRETSVTDAPAGSVVLSWVASH